MRFLITGANGQLGSDLVEILSASVEHTVVGLDLPTLDITDADSVTKELAWASPDVVVNCAAWTAVDSAEEFESDAQRVNVLGPKLLAEECKRRGNTLVQISTDYVFDGNATQPYSESAAPNPKSAYGRTKLGGELVVREILPMNSYIVRTAWLYGLRGRNFVKTIMKLEREQEVLSIVDDQRGQPTWSRDLAHQVIALVTSGAPFGIYHGTNSGEVSWYGFTRSIFELIGADPERVRPTDSTAFQRPAARPKYSVLGHDAWALVGLQEMRMWDAAIAEAIASGLQPDSE